MINIVILRLYGGLGNQMFQYCAGRRMAILTSSELVLDTVSGFKRDTKYNRSYALGELNVLGRKTRPSERLEPFERFRRFAFKRLQLFIPKRSRTYITESSWDIFNNKIAPMGNRIYLDGYWQTSTHFLAYAELLRTELRLGEMAMAPILDVKNMVLSEQSVAIHIRWFGKDAEFSETKTGEAYYRNAIQRIEELVCRPKFYVFSDKPTLASQLMEKFDIKYQLISDVKTDMTAEQEMYIISECKHKIIGNSTFGWWSAALSERIGGYVICPEPATYSGVKWGSDGMLLDSWLKL